MMLNFSKLQDKNDALVVLYMNILDLELFLPKSRLSFVFN